MDQVAPGWPARPAQPPMSPHDVIEEKHELLGINLVVTAVFLMMVIWLSTAAERRHLPASFVSIAMGTLLGLVLLLTGADAVSRSVRHLVVFPTELFSYLLLPPIIYEAGFSTATKRFFTNLPTILLLAIVGTTVSTFIIGTATQAAGNAAWFRDTSHAVYSATSDPLDFSTPLHSFVFGSLISATDAVATLSILGAAQCDATTYTLVFGESVLNDAVAIVFVRILKRMGHAAFDEPWSALLDGTLLFCAVSAGSIAVGAAVSASSALLLRCGEMREQPALELSLVVLLGYTSYCLSEALSCSGIVALFVTGVFVGENVAAALHSHPPFFPNSDVATRLAGHYHVHSLSKTASKTVGVVLKSISNLAETAVFAMIGLSLTAPLAYLEAAQGGAAAAVEEEGQTDREQAGKGQIEVMTSLKMPGTWRFVVFATLIVPLSRFVMVPPLCALANLWQQPQISRRTVAALMCAGLRGAVAYALAIEAASDDDSAAGLVSATAAVVITTTFIGGGTTRKVLASADMATHQLFAPEAPGTGWVGLTLSRWLRFDQHVVGPALVGQARWRATPLDEET